MRLAKKFSTSHTFKNTGFWALHLCFLTIEYNKNVLTIQWQLYGSIEFVKGYKMPYFILSFVSGQKFFYEWYFLEQRFLSMTPFFRDWSITGIVLESSGVSVECKRSCRARKWRIPFPFRWLFMLFTETYLMIEQFWMNLRGWFLVYVANMIEKLFLTLHR